MIYITVILAILFIMAVITIFNSISRVSELIEENYQAKAENYELHQINTNMKKQMIRFRKQIHQIQQYKPKEIGK